MIGQSLDGKLEEAYAEIRKKEPAPFQTPQGGFKSFKEVRDLIAERVYADFLKSISSDATHRLVGFMEEARESLIQEKSDSSYIKQSGDPLQDQWMLVKNVREVKRSDPLDFSKQELFALAAGSWSKVNTPEHGNINFYYLTKKESGTDSISEQLDQAQKILGMDARRLLMHEVLDRVESFR